MAALQSQASEDKPKFVDSNAHGQADKSGGYTYSPSSTFQMAGNEQIQGKCPGMTNDPDRSQYKFHYVAMNPGTSGVNNGATVGGGARDDEKAETRAEKPHYGKQHSDAKKHESATQDKRTTPAQ